MLQRKEWNVIWIQVVENEDLIINCKKNMRRIPEAEELTIDLVFKEYFL